MRDAAFIVMLRTDPRRSSFIGPTTSRIEDQEVWLERYFARDGDYYFIVERVSDGAPVGTIAIYDENRVAKSAQWGRWISQVGTRSGIEGLLLVYRVAFDVLGLDMVYSHTV